MRSLAAALLSVILFGSLCPTLNASAKDCVPQNHSETDTHAASDSNTPVTLDVVFAKYVSASNNVSACKNEDDKLKAEPSASIHRLLTDNITVVFKPQFGNTFPNLLGNPVVGTDQFTFKPNILGVTYELPLKNIPSKKKTSGLWRYVLNFSAIGISSGIGPKSETVLDTLLLQKSLQATTTVYFQYQVSGKQLREAHEQPLQDEINKRKDEKQKALEQLVDALSRKVVELEKQTGAGQH